MGLLLIFRLSIRRKRNGIFSGFELGIFLFYNNAKALMKSFDNYSCGPVAQSG